MIKHPKVLKDQRNLPFSSFSPAIIIGLQESFSLTGITVVLLFYAWLSKFGKSKIEILFIGFFFFFAIFSTRLALVLGIFDEYFVRKPFELSLIFISGIIFLVFLKIGFGHLYNWRNLRKFSNTSNEPNSLPLFLTLQKTESAATKQKLKWQKASSFALIIILTGLLGNYSILIGGLWGEDQYLYILHSTFFSGQNTQYALSRIFVNTFIYCLPILIVWLTMICACQSKGIKLFVRQNIALYNIIISAVYLATAISTLILHILRYQATS